MAISKEAMAQKLNLRKGELKKEKEEKESGFQDNRFWKMVVPSKREALAQYKQNQLIKSTVLRFLPDKNLNMYKTFKEHNFKFMKDGSQAYYWKPCVTMKEEYQAKDCPICSKVQEYYKSTFESDKKLGQERRAKINYIANILVIKDSEHPENDGKIFLFKFGKTIFDKISQHLFFDQNDPEYKKALESSKDTGIKLEVTKEMNPFDLYEGANFVYNANKGSTEFPTYEFSTFAPISELPEKYMDIVYDSEKNEFNTYDLDEYMAEYNKKIPTIEEVTKDWNIIIHKADTSYDGGVSSKSGNSSVDTDEIDKFTSEMKQSPIETSHINDIENDIDDINYMINDIKSNKSSDDDMDFLNGLMK